MFLCLFLLLSVQQAPSYQSYILINGQLSNSVHIYSNNKNIHNMLLHLNIDN